MRTATWAVVVGILFVFSLLSLSGLAVNRGDVAGTFTFLSVFLAGGALFVAYLDFVTSGVHCPVCGLRSHSAHCPRDGTKLV